RATDWLINHQSLPLVAILKAMNIYSNNPMADQMTNKLGGPSAVMSIVQEVTQIPTEEIALINGSGLGEENQLSPRAAVSLFQAIHYLLRASGSTDFNVSYTISDIFPVTGADGGTVRNRSLPGNTVVKTGSLAVVSALAGALPTKNRGVVWFSLLNYGSGLEALRSRQDQVISALERQWGKADDIPPELATTVKIGVDPYRFGDARRNLLINHSL
ncbi:MAG: D-alanyl-D-alanine carboxypeptidase, partial [Cyanobacteria bacterium P01_D01_bin.105]